MRAFVWILGTFLISFSLKAQQLDLSISAIKKQKGEILIAVFNKADGFPFDTQKAYQLLKGTPVDGKLNLQVSSLPKGRYAIALFHDANGDGTLNVNFMGIPKEGYGVSNNAYNTFSAPKYNDASFDYNQSSVLKITMKY